MKFILIFLLAAVPAFADSIIAVTGTAEKSIEPTHIQLRLEVWGKAGTAKQAQVLAGQQFKNLKAQVEKFKVKKEDFRTEQFQLNPEYSYRNNESPQVTGYRSSQTVAIDFRKIDELGSFLDSLLVPGKNQTSGLSVQGLQWDSDKKMAVERELLAVAIKDGKSKAQEMAEAADVKIKKLQFLSDSPVQISAPEIPMARGRFAEKAMMAQDSGTVEVAGGQIKVKVQVSMSFELQ